MHQYRYEMAVSGSTIALTGTIGAGKTTLAEAISEELHERRIRHALLDLDWLGQVYPTPEGHDPYSYELAFQNLKQIWPNFQTVGADRVVVAGTLLSQDHRERLQDALGLPIFVVLVEAPREVLEVRIRNRNSGRLLGDFLARIGQVARTIREANIHDFEVETHQRAPREVAQLVLRNLRWIPAE